MIGPRHSKKDQKGINRDPRDSYEWIPRDSFVGLEEINHENQQVTVESEEQAQLNRLLEEARDP